MCLIVRFDKDQLKGVRGRSKATLLKLATKVATKPIVCYKRLERNSTMNSNGKVIKFWETAVQGFHWPENKLVKVKEFGVRKLGNHDDVITIDEGLHAYTTRSIAVQCRWSNNEKIKEMIIPKGTRYIEYQGYLVALAMRMKTKSKKK